MYDHCHELVPDFCSAGPERRMSWPASAKVLNRARALLSAQPSSFDCMMRTPCAKGRAPRNKLNRMLAEYEAVAK